MALLNHITFVLFQGSFDGRPRYVERDKVHGEPFQFVTPAEIIFCEEIQAWVFRHEDIKTSIVKDQEVNKNFVQH